MRPSRRAADELRAVSLERGVVKYAEGSCLVKFGDTHVLVTATLEERLPPWLKGQGRGWVTAEYGMLPRATLERTRREAAAGKQGGRTVEIQRLIGRSLRAALDLEALGERQITVDCDVIQADGGTRTAAITGGFVALHDCITWMKTREMLKADPLRDHVAAISCGICNGTAVPLQMPQEMAATWSRSGSALSISRVFIQVMQSCSATKPPVIAAVRVPPSAWMTSQSTVICRSPSASRSSTARRLRPIRRWISTVRQVCFPAEASRRVRSEVARGCMPYSAVIQPCAWPLSQGGSRSS